MVMKLKARNRKTEAVHARVRAWLRANPGRWRELPLDRGQDPESWRELARALRTEKLYAESTQLCDITTAVKNILRATGGQP